MYIISVKLKTKITKTEYKCIEADKKLDTHTKQNYYI